MSTKTGLLYATVDGQTLKVCNEIVANFKKNGQEIELFSINDFKGKVTDFDKFVIGSSIRYGVHNKKIIDFINANKGLLDTVKTAFFSVNLVARKPEKNKARTPIIDAVYAVLYQHKTPKIIFKDLTELLD